MKQLAYIINVSLSNSWHFDAIANEAASMTNVDLLIIWRWTIRLTLPPKASFGPLPWLVAKYCHLMFSLWWATSLFATQNMNRFLYWLDGSSVQMNTDVMWGIRIFTSIRTLCVFTTIRDHHPWDSYPPVPNHDNVYGLTVSHPVEGE